MMAKNKKVSQKIFNYFFIFLIIAQLVVFNFQPKITKASELGSANVGSGSGMVIPPVITPGISGMNPGLSTQTSMNELKRDLDENVKTIQESLTHKIFNGLLLSSSVLVRNTAIMMSKKLAEGTVRLITTGDWGQEPMFTTAGWQEYLKNTGYQVAGYFIDNLSEAFGRDFCDPGALLELPLKLQLQFDYLDVKYTELNKPNCDLMKFKDNWQGYLDYLQTKLQAIADLPTQLDKGVAASLFVLDSFTDVGFNPQSTDIGIILQVKSQLDEKILETQDADTKTRQEGDGWKAVTSMDGTIKTPSSLVKAHSKEELSNAKKTWEAEWDTTMSVLETIPLSAASTFINTFASRLWTDYIVKKYFNIGLVSKKTIYDPLKRTFDAKAQLEKEFSQQKISFSFDSKQMDLTAEFTTCPSAEQNVFRGLNNCVMDSDFAMAIVRSPNEKPLTVAEAIEQDSLHENWPLIGPKDSRNNNADCYSGAYCYSNLMKLRKARILPIGWEIAAGKIEAGEVVTLEQAIAGFNNCPETTEELATAESPTSGFRFCHLIDPNWVLRYPETMCKANVKGPLLSGSSAGERADYCADPVSCLSMDDKGICRSYGYCAAEKNIFRFGGDSCQGEFNSCLSVISRNENEVSLLMNTVDKSQCDPSNVGCKWYSTDKKLTDSWRFVNNDEQKIFLNKFIEDKECSPSEQGCSRFIRTASGLGTNLIPNGDFEILAAEDVDNAAANLPVRIPGWNGFYRLSKESDRGENSLLVSLNLDLPVIKLAPVNYERYFFASAYINKNADSEVSFSFHPNNQESSFDIKVLAEKRSLPGNSLNTWEEIYLFGAISGKNFGGVFSQLSDLLVKINGENFKVDSIMVEELAEPDVQQKHAYSEYASVNSAYLKKAPVYLSCYNVNKFQCVNNDGKPDYPTKSCSLTSAAVDCNDPAYPVCAPINNEQDIDYGKPLKNDNIYAADDTSSSETQKGCADFARVCSAADVGCEEYKPFDNGATVYGQISYNDFCPQDCVGYDSFSKTASFFEDAQFPLYFIANSAKKCASSNAGCEEFTNLDELDRGAEARAYYSEMRLCAKLPEKQANCQNFYTWEGSDVQGYKLKTFNLEYDNSTGGPKLIMPEYASQCNKEIFYNKTNPDCRQFYDEGGAVFYRLYTKTISCSEDCHPFRRTQKYDRIEDCEQRQGIWNSGECLFMAIPGESKKCSAKDAGCREYKGANSGVALVVENYTFDDYSNSESSELLASYMIPQLSPEFGHYLHVGQGNGLADFGFDSSSAGLFTNNKKSVLPNNSDLLISFWARSSEDSENRFAISLFEGEEFADNQVVNLAENVLLATDKHWQFFSFLAPKAYVSDLRVLGIVANGEFDIDNLKIVKNEDYQYLIRDSWSTPQVCDYKLNTDIANQENYLPQAQLGCRDFADSKNNVYYVKSFSGLCASDRVGCEAVIDTANNQKDIENKIYNFGKSWTCENDSEQVPLTDLGGFVPDYQLVQEFSNLNEQTANPNIPESVLEVPPADMQIQVWSSNLGLGDLGNETISCASAADILENLCETNGHDWSKEKRCGGNLAGQLCLHDNDCSFGEQCLPDESSKTERCYTGSEYLVSRDKLMYLIIQDDIRCEAGSKGCSEVGLPELTISAEGQEIVAKDKAANEIWNSQFFRLDPDLFDRNEENPLCLSSAVGCEEYSAKDGGQKYYFKNPGDKVCEYRSVSGSENGVTTVDLGWYKKKIDPNAADEPCEIEDYYDDGVKSLIKAGDFDSSAGLDGPDIYRGWVGQCSPSEDKCTAFIDPTDLTSSDAGQAYYYINDNKIDRSCTGVSRKQGCVLFNDTSLVNEYGDAQLAYNSFATYINSKNNKGDLTAGITNDSEFQDSENCADYVKCDFMIQCLQEENDFQGCLEKLLAADAKASVAGHQYYCGQDATQAQHNAVCTAKNIMVKDANSIIKVVRDRTCANWYSCRSSHETYDEKQQKFVKFCDEIGLCDQIKMEDNTEGCGHFVDQPVDYNLLSQNKPLTQGSSGIAYGSAIRGVSWHNFDYSGLAIPNKAPLQFYNAYNLAGIDKFHVELTVKRCATGSTIDTEAKACQFDYNCSSGQTCIPTEEKTFKTCGGSLSLGNNGAIACSKNEDCATGYDCLPPKDYRLINVSDLSCKNDTDCEFPTDEIKNFCKVDNEYVCRCLNDRCIKPLAGTDWADQENSPTPTCRAYPEAKTPVPGYWATVDSSAYSQIPKFYIADSEDPSDAWRWYEDFGCSYKTVNYLSQIKYVPYGGRYAPPLPDGFCQSNLNKPCVCAAKTASTDSNNVYINNSTLCTADASSGCPVSEDGAVGYCLKRSNNVESLYKGWQGYCLESDLSIAGPSTKHPCLSWYPTEMLAGLQDWTNQYDKAGFDLASYGFSNSVNYCVESELWEKRVPILVRAYGRLDCDGTEEQRRVYVQQNKIIKSVNSDPLLSDNKNSDKNLVKSDDNGKILNIEDNGDNIFACSGNYSKDDVYYCALIDQYEDDEQIRYYDSADPVAIWEGLKADCWDADSKQDLVSPQGYCPDGYLATDIYDIRQETKSQSFNDEEDAFNFYFKCVPLDSGSQNGFVTDPNGGWFKSDGTPDLTPQDTSIPGNDYTYSITREPQANLCLTYFNVATNTYSHASTDILYQQYKKSSSDKKCGPFVARDLACGSVIGQGLYGAMGLDTSSNNMDDNLLNAFVVLKTCQGEDDSNNITYYDNLGQEKTVAILPEKLDRKCDNDTDCGLTEPFAGCPEKKDDQPSYQCLPQDKTMVACKVVEESETTLPLCGQKDNEVAFYGGYNCFSESSDGQYIKELAGSFVSAPELEAPVFALGLDKRELQNIKGADGLKGVCIDKVKRGAGNSINGQECSDNSDCQSPVATEFCQASSLKKCNDLSDNNKKGKYCYFDSDCKTGEGIKNSDTYEFDYCTVALTDAEMSSNFPFGECEFGDNVVSEGAFEYYNGDCVKKYYEYSLEFCSQYEYSRPYTGSVSGSSATYCSAQQKYASTNEAMKYVSAKESEEDLLWNFIEDGVYKSNDNRSITERAPRIAGIEVSADNGLRAGKSKFTFSYQNSSVSNAHLQINESQPRISIKFFAWAHDEQMPLRRVSVNWGDGQISTIGNKNLKTKSDDNISKYKNHKPRCQEQPHEELGLCAKIAGVNDLDQLFAKEHGLACATHNDCANLGTGYICYPNSNNPNSINLKLDRFGDTTEACAEEYFQFNHTYTCNSSITQMCADMGSLQTNCVVELAGINYCQYRPGVQVLDNWNMCRNSNGIGQYDGEEDIENSACEVSYLSNYETDSRYIRVKMVD